MSKCKYYPSTDVSIATIQLEFHLLKQRVDISRVIIPSHEFAHLRISLGGESSLLKSHSTSREIIASQKAFNAVQRIRFKKLGQERNARFGSE